MKNIFYIGQLDKLPFLLILGAKRNISFLWLPLIYRSRPGKVTDQGPIFEWKKGFMSPSPVSPHLCRVDRSTPAAQTHFWPIGPSIIGDRTAAP
jgi:hypothetical protein